MASLRVIKKDIDYLVEELVADCYLTMYFHPERKEKVLGIMQEAVTLRNDLFARVNNPAEPKNVRLVRKHYSQIRHDMFTGIDRLFTELSQAAQ